MGITLAKANHPHCVHYALNWLAPKRSLSPPLAGEVARRSRAGEGKQHDGFGIRAIEFEAKLGAFVLRRDDQWRGAGGAVLAHGHPAIRVRSQSGAREFYRDREPGVCNLDCRWRQRRPLSLMLPGRSLPCVAAANIYWFCHCSQGRWGTDTGTATIIAAVLSSGASIAVALITMRNRIGVPQTSSEPRVATAATESTSVRKFRGLGWVLVVFLYLMSFNFFSSLLVGSVILYAVTLRVQICLSALCLAPYFCLLRFGLTSVYVRSHA